MGQFAVKIKQMVERLELNSDKNNPTRLSAALLEISNKQTSTSDLRPLEEQTKETKMLLEVMSKLELIETVVENQRQIMGDQEAKLRALENTVRNAHLALEQIKEQVGREEDQVVEVSKETPLSRLIDSIFQDQTKSELEGKEPHEVVCPHEETLQDHEERIQTAIDKIQVIWDRITQDEESMLKAQQEELKEIKRMIESVRQNHNALKLESQIELETQQKILDNLMAGFVVAFVLLVFICMYYK